MVVEGERLLACVESPSESEMVGKDVQRGEGTYKPRKGLCMLGHNLHLVVVWCQFVS